MKDLDPIHKFFMKVVVSDEGKAMNAYLVSDRLIEIPDDYPEELRSELCNLETVDVLVDNNLVRDRAHAFRQVNFRRMFDYQEWKHGPYEPPDQEGNEEDENPSYYFKIEPGIKPDPREQETTCEPDPLE